MAIDAGWLPFCFFILHSAFIICLFEPLQTDVGKTDRRHRAAQSHRATGTMGSGANRPSALSNARSWRQQCAIKLIVGRQAVRVIPASAGERIRSKWQPSLKICGNLNGNRLAGNAIDADAELDAGQLGNVQNGLLPVGYYLNHLRGIKAAGFATTSEFSIQRMVSDRCIARIQCQAEWNVCINAI